jgi:hypothetical protein
MQDIQKQVKQQSGPTYANVGLLIILPGRYSLASAGIQRPRPTYGSPGRDRRAGPAFWLPSRHFPVLGWHSVPWPIKAGSSRRPTRPALVRPASTGLGLPGRISTSRVPDRPRRDRPGRNSRGRDRTSTLPLSTETGATVVASALLQSMPLHCASRWSACMTPCSAYILYQMLQHSIDIAPSHTMATSTTCLLSKTSPRR